VIVVEAPAYIPFEPRTDAARALRVELRERLTTLDIGQDQVLAARFFGPLPKGADVENALLYNIDTGGRVFSRSTATGLRFEHDPTSLPGGGVRYEYRAESAGAGFQVWAPNRLLAHVDCSLDTAPSLAGIWWALREGGIARFDDALREAAEPFAVILSVSGPVAFARPSLVKTVIDGVVCALQSQTDHHDADFTAPLIAAKLGVDGIQVREHLLDPHPSALGTRARLVHRRGSGVQWSPDDDGCVAGEMHLEPSDDWEISGAAVSLIRA
jgi:hypothetical protein